MPWAEVRGAKVAPSKLFTDLVNYFLLIPVQMDIDFASAKLRALCEEHARMVAAFGPPCAKKLQNRLADLEAAAFVTDLVAGRPHPLKYGSVGQFSVDLHGGVRLVFEPNHDPVPRNADKSIAWNQVSKVRIVFIGDYHD